jgi:hypothetical protein
LVDIFPHDGRLNISGIFFLKNSELVAVDTVYVNLPTSKITFSQFNLGGDSVKLEDDYFGIFKVHYQNPLQPGDSFAFNVFV